MEWNGTDAERMEHVVPWNGTGMELSWHGMEWNGTGQPMEWNGMELIWMEWNWNFPFHGTAHPCVEKLLTATQFKRALRKGNQVFFVQVNEKLNEDADFDAKISNQKPEIQEIIRRNKKLFPSELPGLPPKRAIDHPIETTSAPTSTRPYRLSPLEENELKTQVAELVEERDHSAKQFTMGRWSSVCQEEGWLPEDVHRLPSPEFKNGEGPLPFTRHPRHP